jgi:hypothetical protein
MTNDKFIVELWPYLLQALLQRIFQHFEASDIELDEQNDAANAECDHLQNIKVQVNLIARLK